MAVPTCIFAKPPLPGAVKTRLIPVLGASGAAELAGAMLQDTWQTVKNCPPARAILATTVRGDFPWGIPAEDVWLQGDGCLGERIERILTRGLLDAPAVIAIGADSPAFTTAHLEAACAALEANDAVVGPAADGGFYLLAVRKCTPGLLRSLPWSAAETRKALRRRLAEHRWSVAELDPLFDVDTPDDLRLLEAYLTEHPSAAPMTRSWYFQNQCESASSFPR